MFAELNNIATIRTEIERLSAIETKLGQPLLTDFSLLPVLYEWFNDLNNTKDFPKRPESVMQRNKFLLIALRFYSPLTLVGEKMVLGLREELAKTLRLHTPSSISNVCSSLFFYYQNYRTFRYDVNKITINLIERLEKEIGEIISEAERAGINEFIRLNKEN